MNMTKIIVSAATSPLPSQASCTQLTKRRHLWIVAYSSTRHHCDSHRTCCGTLHPRTSSERKRWLLTRSCHRTSWVRTEIRTPGSTITSWASRRVRRCCLSTKITWTILCHRIRFNLNGQYQLSSLKSRKWPWCLIWDMMMSRSEAPYRSGNWSQ